MSFSPELKSILDKLATKMAKLHTTDSMADTLKLKVQAHFYSLKNDAMKKGDKLRLNKLKQREKKFIDRINNGIKNRKIKLSNEINELSKKAKEMSGKELAAKVKMGKTSMKKPVLIGAGVIAAALASAYALAKAKQKKRIEQLKKKK